MMDWNKIQSKAFERVGRKKAAGRWQKDGKWKIGMPATYSMIERNGKEVTRGFLCYSV